MKILQKILILLMVAFLVFPISIKAEEKTYNYLNLDEALKEEEIKHDFSNYKENDDQAVIYLFRGRGCGYCKKFLTFLNSIVDDYGKYFRVESYEVWYNEDNAELLNNVASTLGKEASGVPFIVIGDKSFAGYSEEYDDQIKDAIKKLYKTKKEDRYDVMNELEKENGENGSSVSFGLIAFNVIFTLACSFGVFMYDRSKRNELEERLSKLEK